MAPQRILLLLTAILPALSCAGGMVVEPAPPRPWEGPVQGPAEAPESRVAEEELPLDPEVELGRLENGLTYYIRENSRPEERAEFWLAVNAGSMQEDDDQLGLAHFVEHMAFNGTSHFAKQELVDYLERIGMRFGPDINAFTSFDETVYMLKVPTDDPVTVEQAFQILEDWAHGLAFEDQEIDKERGVVIEEWRLGRGAQARIRDEQFPVLFKDSRYADRLPIGSREILESAPYEALRRFYHEWYRPDLMAVIAVGDFDSSQIENLLRKHFEGLSAPGSARPRQTYPVPDHAAPLYAITTDPEATSTTVGVYQKLRKRPQHRLRDYRRQLTEQLYHGLLNARLDELRQRPDPPFLYAFSTSAGLVRSRDVYLHTAGVQEGGAERGLVALLTEVERVDRHGFTQTELDRMKIDLLRRFEQAFKERDKRDSGSYAGEYLRHFLEGEPSPGIELELQLVHQLLPTIGLEELNHLAEQWISESNRVVLVSGPEKTEVPLPVEATLAETFRAVIEAEIEPYVDKVRSGPLVAQSPRPSPVVEQRNIEEVGLTEWRLGNGVRVVLKPTDFKNDQVLLAGFSPGGHSLVADEDYTSAAFAAAAVGEGGLGEFSRVELEKALAGKVAQARAFIGELEEGVGASASPQDLETMLQLLYLAMTSPRADREAFEGFLARLRASLENRQARPEAVFQDRLTLALYRDHPRRRPPSLEMLDRIDLERALALYRNRFRDASDFTFILVGNFDVETIRPLVESYLGGLPSSGRKESWRDVGAETPDGILEVEVRKGLEPKSRIQLIFGGPAEWSRESVHGIHSLAAAFRIRLREILREDLGATYGVRVSGSIHDRPKGRFAFTIGLGCAPENVERLTKTIFAEIDSLRSEDLDASYAQKVRESQLRRRETDLKENPFWLAALKLYYSRSLDPRLLLDYAQLVEGVTPANLRASAERYLNPDNYLLGLLYPAESGGSATQRSDAAEGS